MQRSTIARPRFLPVAFLLSLLLAGCGGGDAAITQPPEGWERDGARWWESGIDTSDAFRDLDNLQSMGVAPEVVYAANQQVAAQATLRRDQLEAAVQRALVRLYRNEPEVVDSLFQQVALPVVERASLEGNPEELVERTKVRAYQAIRRHFREPQPTLRVGEDVPVAYPDSLRDRGIGGAVRMQVRIDAEGRPVAIELIQRVHPVLDAIALRATTSMRWQPAYLLQRNEWKEIPSWSRFTIRFSAPE